MNRDVFFELSTLRAEIGDLRVQLAEAQAIAGPWQPVMESNTELDDPIADDDRGIFVHGAGRGLEFFCDGGELEGYFELPDGYAICKRNEGLYVTVHRSYIENLEAKANRLAGLEK